MESAQELSVENTEWSARRAEDGADVGKVLHLVLRSPRQQLHQARSYWKSRKGWTGDPLIHATKKRCNEKDVPAHS